MSEQVLIGVISALAGWLARHWQLGMGKAGADSQDKQPPPGTAAHPILTDLLDGVRSIVREELTKVTVATAPPSPTKTE